MATLGTMVERIRSELHQGPATSGTAWGNEVRLQIRDAIRRLQGEHLWWSEGDFTLTCVVDQEEYELNAAGGVLATKLPADLQAIVDDLYLREDGDQTLSYPLTRLNRADYLSLVEGWDEAEGTPYYWTFYEKTLRLWPEPDAEHIVVGRYQRNFANFDAEWNGSAWTIDADSTTSAWFTIEEAEEAVRTLAQKNLCAKFLKDLERASVFAAEHALALNQLRRETSKKNATGAIRPWLPC